MSFATMKKNRNKSLESLIKETEKINSPSFGNGDDDRFWRTALDKSGNGYAVIRFLPAPTGEDVPWVRTFNHGFQGPGGWYIENSLTTLGQKDPVSEYNTSLWNSGIEANKDIARKQKRRLTYISNVYIVKDPSNPENEGTVRLFKYGKKIFDKVNDMMNPTFEDETPRNPFDLWEGANFKMKIRKVDGFSNYDKSEFDNPAPLLEDDDKMEEVWKTQHSLQEFLAPDNFKSYNDLKVKLDKILGTATVPTVANEPSPKLADPPFDGGKPFIPTEATQSYVPPTAETEDAEGLNYFSKLAATA
jgi:hypothetical protein